MLLKQIIQQILEGEAKHRLFSLTYKGYSIWSYYRMYFYYDYTKNINTFDSSVSAFKKDFQYIKQILNIFNLFKVFAKKDYFILEHPRSDKDKIDIYTSDLVKYVGEDKCSFFSFSNNGLINKKERVVILDLIKIISKIISKIMYRFLPTSYFISFKQFLLDLETDKHQSNNYIKNYKRYYIELIIQYHFYYFLLKTKNVKKVILTVSYYNMPLVFAAKNLNIETIECQHGVISKYHLGYHYPYYETSFFPDKLITFSSFWDTSATFPRNTQLLALGNNFLSKKDKKLNKIKNTILIVSQATIGKKLECLILKNLKNLKDFKIYFKLHPSEFNNSHVKYKKLYTYENIQIVSVEYNIEELQNISEYQIGIYSTSIYEGLEKQCKTILLDDTGIEYMEELINKQLVSKINLNEKLIDYLKNTPMNQDIIFFERFNHENIEGII